MAYTVTIISTDGNENTYPCGGSSDQQALIFAGKVVEQKGDPDDPGASVVIKKDNQAIGVPAIVRDMITRAV